MTRRSTRWRHTATGPVLVLVAFAQPGCGGGSSDSGAPPAPPARQQKELTDRRAQARLPGLRSLRISIGAGRCQPCWCSAGWGTRPSRSWRRHSSTARRSTVDSSSPIPTASAKTWNAGYCCGTAAKDGVDDPAPILVRGQMVKVWTDTVTAPVAESNARPMSVAGNATRPHPVRADVADVLALANVMSALRWLYLSGASRSLSSAAASGCSAARSGRRASTASRSKTRSTTSSSTWPFP
jgi:hypothetical protein